MTNLLNDFERQNLHYVTLVLPVLYLASLFLWRHWLRSPSSAFAGTVRVIRTEVDVRADNDLIVSNIVWAGRGLLRVGEQVLGGTCALFHFLFLANVLLEVGWWRYIAVAGACLNLTVATTVLYSIFDNSRDKGSARVLRFQTDAS